MSDECYEQNYIKEAFDTNWIALLVSIVDQIKPVWVYGLYEDE